MSGLMDGINDAINSAVDEAAEAGREVVSEDAPEQEQESTEQEYDGAPEGEAVEEQETAPESEQEEDQPEDGGEQADPYDWLEKLDEVPTEKLPPRVAKLRADRDRMASEIGEMRKRLAELEAVKGEPQEPQQSPGPEDAMPELPTEEDSFPEVIRKMREVARWEARQEAKGVDQRYQEKFQTIEEREKQQELQQHQQYFASQAQRIEATEGYDENVGNMMSAVAAESPAWRQELGSPQGWDKLFNYAKFLADQHATSEAQRVKEQQTTTKKATARQRAVPRGSTKPKHAEPDVELPEDPSNISGRMDAIMGSWRG